MRSLAQLWSRRWWPSYSLGWDPLDPLEPCVLPSTPNKCYGTIAEVKGKVKPLALEQTSHWLCVGGIKASRWGKHSESQCVNHAAFQRQQIQTTASLVLYILNAKRRSFESRTGGKSAEGHLEMPLCTSGTNATPMLNAEENILKRRKKHQSWWVLETISCLKNKEALYCYDLP